MANPIEQPFVNVCVEEGDGTLRYVWREHEHVLDFKCFVEFAVTKLAEHKRLIHIEFHGLPPPRPHFEEEYDDTVPLQPQESQQVLSEHFRVSYSLRAGQHLIPVQAAMDSSETTTNDHLRFLGLLLFWLRDGRFVNITDLPYAVTLRKVPRMMRPRVERNLCVGEDDVEVHIRITLPLEWAPS